MNFDLLRNGEIPLENIMERYGLGFSSPGIQREYLQRFLFFINNVRNVYQNNSLIILNPLNDSDEFRKNNCFSYKILIENAGQVRSCENSLLDRLFSEYGPLRSIDGNKDKFWSLGKYIY